MKLFTYKELNEEEVRAIEVPSFQRELDNRPKKLAEAYIENKEFTSSPIYLMEKDNGKYSIIDGQHRRSGYLIATEHIKGLKLPVVIKKRANLRHSMKDEFLIYNQFKAVSFGHRAFISKEVEKLKGKIMISAKTTTASTISSADLVKVTGVFMGGRTNGKVSSNLDDYAEYSDIERLTYGRLSFEICTNYKAQCNEVKRGYKQQVAMMIAKLMRHDITIDTSMYYDLANRFYIEGNSKKEQATEAFINAVAPSINDKKKLKAIKEVLLDG